MNKFSGVNRKIGGSGLKGFVLSLEILKKIKDGGGGMHCGVKEVDCGGVCSSHLY